MTFDNEKNDKNFSFLEENIDKNDVYYLKNFVKTDKKACDVLDEIEILTNMIGEDNQIFIANFNEMKIEIDALKVENEKLKNALNKKGGGRPKYPEAKRSKIISLLEKKISYRDICRIMKCSTKTVVQIAKENKEVFKCLD